MLLLSLLHILVWRLLPGLVILLLYEVLSDELNPGCLSSTSNKTWQIKISLSFGSLFSFHLSPILFVSWSSLPLSVLKNSWCLTWPGVGVTKDVLMSLASSTSLDVFWGSNYEPRDSVECSHGCLEGPGIFLESFHFLRALIVVCGEGEVMGVMA